MELKLLILLSMIVCHIYDDYHIQGCLADMKQKSWWDKQTNDIFYRDDYKMALAEHAFGWSFFINLPLVLFYLFSPVLIKDLAIFIVINCLINTIIHAFVDDLKANKKKINLVQDQLFHYIQVLITWGIFILIV